MLFPEFLALLTMDIESLQTYPIARYDVMIVRRTRPPFRPTPRSLQLTVIAISDHHTRVSMGGGAQEAGGRVIGLLFGSQNGLDVSIFDAMEVACTKTQDDGMELIEDFIEKQKDLCKYSTRNRW